MKNLSPSLPLSIVQRTLIVWIVIAAVALGSQWLASWFQPHPTYYWMTDSPEYWKNAGSLIADGRIENPFYPMGASMLMAPFRALGLGPYDIVLLVHPLLHMANALFAYAIVRRFATGWRPMVAGLWVALYFPALNYGRQLLSEPWSLTILLAMLFAVVRPGWRWAGLAGMLSGLSVLVRTPMLGVWFLMLVAFVLLRRPRVELMAFALSSLLVLSFGTAMATRSTGHFTFLTTQGSMAISRMSVPGGEISLPADQQRASYLDGFRQDPASFMIQRFWAFANVTSPWPLGDSRSFAIKLIIFASDIPVLALATISLLGLCRNSSITSISHLLFLLVPAIGLIAFYTLFTGQNRYRMPYYPPLICLALAGLHIKERRQSNIKPCGELIVNVLP